MRLVLILSCALALAAPPALAAQAEPTKTAAGTITSVAGSSVTVKTASGDMTFNIDAKTHVIAPGGDRSVECVARYRFQEAWC